MEYLLFKLSSRLCVKTISQETGQQTLFLITLRSEVDNFLFVLSLPTVPCCPVLPSHLNLCHLSEVQQQQERRPGRPGQHPQPPQDHQTLQQRTQCPENVSVTHTRRKKASCDFQNVLGIQKDDQRQIIVQLQIVLIDCCFECLQVATCSLSQWLFPVLIDYQTRVTHRYQHQILTPDIYIQHQISIQIPTLDSHTRYLCIALDIYLDTNTRYSHQISMYSTRYLDTRVAGLSCPDAGGCKSAILRGFPDVFGLFGP